jgi:NADP-dependent 3-hydroxy acid dehydrogenase YdfG
MPQRKRVVVVTGASAGVGRATVRAFARQGADIGLLARGRADAIVWLNEHVWRVAGVLFGGLAVLLAGRMTQRQARL